MVQLRGRWGGTDTRAGTRGDAGAGAGAGGRDGTNMVKSCCECGGGFDEYEYDINKLQKEKRMTKK